MIVLRTVLQSMGNKWHFKGNRCLSVYWATHRKGEVEDRKVQCILHKESSLCSARSDPWLVSVLHMEAPSRKFGLQLFIFSP